VDASHHPRRELLVSLVLGVVWAGIVALPLAIRARRVTIAARAKPFREAPRRRSPPVAAAVEWVRARPVVASVLRVVTAPRRRRAARRHADDIARALAIAVDLVGVGVAAGGTPYVAVELGAAWTPPVIGRELDVVLRGCAMGQSFDDALRKLGVRVPPTRPLTEALRTSALLGAPVAPALARLAVDVRTDLRRRAEARARSVPVWLCFPLVLCILPAFALLTVVPVVLDGLQG
jgi:Flp pilus assembly protein TadB